MSGGRLDHENHETGEGRERFSCVSRPFASFVVQDAFATVRKGIVNTEFFRWYRRKVLNRLDKDSLKSSTSKFFKFLAKQKDIYNEKVLGKRKK